MVGPDLTVTEGDSGLRVAHLRKSYRKRVVIRDVSMELMRGEVVALVAPSGAGKSTLLHIAGLLDVADAGEVAIGGEVMGRKSDRRRTVVRRQMVGFVYQFHHLLPEFTAAENIVLPIEIRDGKAAAKKAMEAAHDLLEMVGLKGFEDVYPNELSGGMAQRASICRMLITEPAVLLLDEPFSALDELSRDLMNMELQRICREQNATAFLVTHSIQEAVILSDDIVVMKPRPGRIAEVVPVDLPRPRTLDMMTTQKFGEIVDRIRAMLDKGEDM